MIIVIVVISIVTILSPAFLSLLLLSTDLQYFFPPLPVFMENFGSRTRPLPIHQNKNRTCGRKLRAYFQETRVSGERKGVGML